MLKKLIPAAVVLIALAVIALFLDSGVFIIKDVVISGETGMDEMDVIRLAGVDMGGRMRTFDESGVRRNVESSGLLKCIKVEKSLPSTVVITAERRVPRMVSDLGGSMVLMDGEGYVISVTREMPEGDYLYVTGLSPRDGLPGRLIGSDMARIEALTAVVKAIDTTGVQEYISEINVDDTDGIYLYSRTGIQVIVGDIGELENKLIWMKYVLVDLESRGETSGKLDVTGGKQADFSAN